MDKQEFTPPPASVPIVHCRHCRYWDASLIEQPTKTPEGLCRRHAPSPAMLDETVDNGTSWPRTFEDDWCGDGAPLEQA
ncbi:MAG: hypothetical protein ACON41_02045 [Parvibaculales bacterium]